LDLKVRDWSCVGLQERKTEFVWESIGATGAARFTSGLPHFCSTDDSKQKMDEELRNDADACERNGETRKVQMSGYRGWRVAS
jgi:hypothetical protein